MKLTGLPPVPEDRDRRLFAGEVRMRPLEGRADAAPRTVIDGYAAMFNQETTIGDWFREVIDPAAFNDAVGRDDVRGAFNHDPNLILGRTTAKTLRLAVDGNGLKYEIDPPDTTYARDLVVSIGRGDVTGSSFSFLATKEEWTEPAAGSNELPLRRILQAELYDVAPCTYPAYEVASVAISARSHADATREARARAAQVATDAAGAPASRARAKALALAIESAAL